MKIIVKNKDVNLKIPLPMGLASFAIRIAPFFIKKCANNMDEKSKKYIDMIDFYLLSESLRELKKFKGMNLVEVNSSDGTYVLIRI